MKQCDIGDANLKKTRDHSLPQNFLLKEDFLRNNFDQLINLEKSYDEEIEKLKLLISQPSHDKVKKIDLDSNPLVSLENRIQEIILSNKTKILNLSEM